MAERNPSDDQAAFGVFPQLQRNRSKQDREAAKNVPIDLARGAVAGVLGAPGDIESLVRMLPYLDEKTVLPTSEDIEKRLPLRSETPVSKAATGLGILGGGFYTGPGSPLRVAGALPSAIKRGAQDFALASAAGAPHVVKPSGKGANWLGGQRGSVEAQLGKMKMADWTTPEQMAEMQKSIDTAKRIMADDPNAQRTVNQMENELATAKRNNAINSWIDSNLRNYVKNQMATPDDPVRKLAEEGILHMAPYGDQGAVSSRLMNKRMGLGQDPLGMGRSDPARFWERMSDISVDAYPAGSYKHGSLDESLLKDNPWLQKVPDETMIYSGKGLGGDLGFDHIIDVLRQDVREGRIRPEQLNKVSMEQAVRRVHEYDQEMARRMAQAQAKATEGMPVHKEYPEGYKWLQLTAPKIEALPEGASFQKLPTGLTQIVDSSGTPLTVPGKDEAHALRLLERERGQKPLEDALTYEGDTMGHCVGGYCPDVLAGRSKIYSLRDAKGEPHVTIETSPEPHPIGTTSRGNEFPHELRYGTIDDNYSQIPQEQQKEIYDLGKKLYDEKGGDVHERFQEAANTLLGPRPENIVQIKGKQNRKPNEEYLPFVQDFVKSGKWTSIGDLKNTGLIREGDQIMTPAEHADWLLKQLGNPPAEGMKRGGVAISHNPDTMMMAVNDKRMKEGGAEDDTKPYFGGAGTKKYAAAKKRAEDADVNLLKDPKTYAAVMGLLGEAPDEMGFSVLHPNAQGIKDVADPAFYAGTALGVAPLMKAFKAPAMALGRAGEKYAEKVVPQIMERGGIGADILGGLAQGTRSNVYLPHTPKKPDPNVGSRFKTEHVGNLAPKHEFDVEKNQGSSVMSNPWDLTSRGEKVLEVSDTPMIEPIITEGGHDFARDLAHIEETIGGASGRQIAERMQDRVNDAYFANMLDKGTGRVYTMPSTMDITGSNYSTMPTDIIMDFFKQAELKPKDVNRITDDLRTFMFEAERGKFKNAAPVGSPEFLRQLREGGEGFSAGDLRKGFMDRMSKAEYQKMLGYNIEDVYGAIHDPALKGVPKGFVGNTMIETSPFAEVKPSMHQSYDTANAGKYAGSMPSMPLELMMPDLYQYMETKFLSDPRYQKLTPNQLRTMIVNTIEKRGSVISQPINQRVVDNVMRYKEGLKQGHFKPNDYQGIMEFMRRTGGYKDGGTVKKAAGGAITGDDLIIEERPL